MNGIHTILDSHTSALEVGPGFVELFFFVKVAAVFVDVSCLVGFSVLVSFLAGVVDVGLLGTCFVVPGSAEARLVVAAVVGACFVVACFGLVVPGA
jgi:hypothetical protein